MIPIQSITLFVSTQPRAPGVPFVAGVVISIPGNPQLRLNVGDPAEFGVIAAMLQIPGQQLLFNAQEQTIIKVV